MRVRHGDTTRLVLDGNQLGSRAIYLRDSDSGDFWRLGQSDGSRCRHGLGYTIIEETIGGLELSWTITTAPDAAMEIWQLQLKNPTDQKRRLGVFWLSDWATDQPAPARRGQAISNGVTATVRSASDRPATDFFCLDKELSSFDTSRGAFFGENENWERPSAVVGGKCSRTLGAGEPLIGVLQKNIVLGSGATLSYAAFLGAVDGPNPAKQISALLLPYIRPGTLDQLVQVTSEQFLADLQHQSIKTSELAVSAYVNHWLGYQNLIQQHWPEPTIRSLVTTPTSLAAAARAGLPYKAAGSIELAEQALSQTFKDGRLISGWGNGEDLMTASAASDNIAVIELAIAAVKETGDKHWLTKHLPYYDGGSGSVLEHLLRIISAAYEQIEEQLVRLGQNGSTREACRLIGAMKEIAVIHIHLGDHDLETKFQKQIERLTNAVNGRFWLSPWYSRGAQNGEKFSTKKGPAAFDLGTQTAAILNGVAAQERAGQVLRAIKKHWPTLAPNISPSYDQPQAEAPLASLPVPGHSDNGAVQTSLIAELAQAWTVVGDGDNAWQLIETLLPIENKKITDPSHRQTDFFTAVGRELIPQRLDDSFGSAEPVARVIREQILGIQPTVGGLKVDPCLPKSWRVVELSRRFRGADYHFRFQNPFRLSRGVDRIVIDGIRLNGNVIRPFTTGVHFVEVTLG